MRFLVTGGSGFIGSSLVRHIINKTSFSVINIDKLTYASNPDSLFSIKENSRYSFEKTDVCDAKSIRLIFKKYKPDIVMHLAAETHVDKSINGPDEFLETNVFGTYVMLEESKSYWLNLKGEKKTSFRFHHISTDEVYGDLGNSDNTFDETSPYAPSSPYSATKASSNHLVNAWHRTFKLPTLITNCSNNYGFFQFPEKLIPLIILNAIEGKNLPIYGDGKQIRDWLYVDDHAKALLKVALNGKLGESYNIGGNNQLQNIQVVKTICDILDELMPNKLGKFKTYHELITFVNDRPGHDFKYAVNTSKIKNELNWSPDETFETGIRKTIKWYLNNREWCGRVKNKNVK